jgi:hypothetical protein
MPSAIVNMVTIDPARQAEADEGLVNQVVPMCQGLAGYVTSVHVGSSDGTRGIGIIVFDTEESARAAAQTIGSNAPPDGAPVTIESSEIWRVAYSEWRQIANSGSSSPGSRPSGNGAFHDAEESPGVATEGTAIPVVMCHFQHPCSAGL